MDLKFTKPRGVIYLIFPLYTKGITNARNRIKPSLRRAKPHTIMNVSPLQLNSFFSCASIIKARSPACCLLLNDKYLLLLLLLATWQYVALVKLPNVFTAFFDATKMAVVGPC